MSRRRNRAPLSSIFDDSRKENERVTKIRKIEEEKLKIAKNKLPEVDDCESLELLNNVQQSWNNTPNSSQSDDCKKHILSCFESNIDENQIQYYLVQNNIDTESRINYALSSVNPPALSVVDNVSTRTVLQPSDQERITQELTEKFDLDDNGRPKNFTMQPFMRTKLREQNFVYGLPLKLIKSISKGGVLNIDDVLPFVKQHQVEMKLDDEQITEFITKATDSPDFNITMQGLLNNESPYDEEYIWYKGVLYINSVDAPEALMDEIKEECPQLHRLLTVSHIGESGTDLLAFRKKMLNELTYLAGATLNIIGILIPFGYCTSYTLEQSCHIVNIKERVNGELYGNINALEVIKNTFVRIGGGIRFQTSISLAGEELSEPVKKDTLGSLYAWCIALESDDVEALKQIWQSLDGDCVEERKYLEWLLAWKLGCTENNFMIRVRRAFWVWACSIRYIARDNVPDVYKAERDLQRTYDEAGLRIAGERFKLGSLLSDTEDSPSEIQKLREQWGGNDLDDNNFHSNDKLEREWNKCVYREREVKLFLALGLVELSHIVDLVMGGDVELLL